MGEKNRSGVRVERRNGRDILVIDFWYRTKDGRDKRHRRDARVQTKTAARSEADHLKRYAAEHGTVQPPAAVPTFESFVREQFVPLVMPGYTPATRERYDRLLFKEGVVAQLGAKRLDEIGARELMELHACVRARGAIPRQHHILVRGVLRTAVKLNVIARMPDLPNAPKQSRKLPAAPPREVVEAALNGSKGWLQCAIALAFFATMRNGEARAFRVMDIDDDVIARVRQAFSHDQVRSPKYGGDRAVPMHPRLKEILTEASRGKKPTDFVIQDERGRSPSRQRLYKAFVALQRRLGISPTWSFHQLRHAFGSHAVRAGANIEAIRELMGHKDLTTTTRYVHAVAKDKAGVILALDGKLGGNEKAPKP